VAAAPPPRDALVEEATAALRDTGRGSEATAILAEAARFVAARQN
jgi:hypothetical protein